MFGYRISISIFILIPAALMSQNNLWTINYGYGELNQIVEYANDSTFNEIWTGPLGDYSDFVIGDADNDGQDELLFFDKN